MHSDLLDIVQTPRVWLENGGMMEHLIQSDTEEDYIQLKHTDTHIQVNIVWQQA